MYLFTIKYGCRDASPGHCAIKADNAYEATQKFFKNWSDDYSTGKCQIPPIDLLWFRVERWCDSKEVIEEEP